ncbi:uncharacterized protein LOC133842586 [Drosophila sulfurigaster albostrigata]|uniref:uncharacterized protein LOC133842586 n=1 Tax=Drosophila sulfurigaster albostrigata TaxID=89887 RepID=UPI002D21D3B9|nr:uncharacterized protein LOC133842586 [Drosophila sulfurigaster albostrigata]
MKVISIVGPLLLLICTTGFARANTATSCYSCYGINCQRTSLSEEQTCSDVLDYCVTIYDEAKVLYKGCSLEIPVQLSQRCESRPNDSCYKCNSDRCNNVGSRQYACVQCDASTDSNCAENATSLEPSVCAAPTAANSYCYVKSSGTTSTIVRGCSTTFADQMSCLNDANCALCSPGDIRGCNSVNISTDSSRFIRFFEIDQS